MRGYCVKIYKDLSIWYDDDELFPFVVKDLFELYKLDNRITCRFKSLSAAKAAITRFLKS